MRGRVRLVDRD